MAGYRIWNDWPADVLATLRRGTVIPAHLLALDAATVTIVGSGFNQLSTGNPEDLAVAQ